LIEALQGSITSTNTLPASTPPAATPKANVAPAFDLATVDGERMTLDGLLAPGKPTLLMFADPGCGPCAALTPDIAEWQTRFGNEVTMAVISRGTLESNQDKFVAKGVSRIGLQEEWEVFTAYEVRGTPSAVLVDADGIIRQPYATGRDNIRNLVSRTVSPDQPAAATPPAGLNPGDDPLADILRKAEGPDLGSGSSRLPLPTMDGTFLSLDDFRGQKTAVVFWNVTCGFCQRMLADLKEIEQEAGEKISQMLIVSQGDIEANREQGLKSRMVIDDGFTMGKAFGANGTPSAIVLDEEGKVASSLAVGAEAVLNLLDETLALDADTPAQGSTTH
jgi:thiol-disulfide isomerase/thioredoxin